MAPQPIVLALLLLTGQTAAPATGLDRAEALVASGHEAAVRASAQQDRAARDAARKQLEEAESLARQELKRRGACEKCHELITASVYYRASLKAGKGHDDAIEAAAAGLAQFPTNATLLFFKGYAHYARNESAAAAKALNQYLMASRGAFEPAPEVRSMLQESRRKFLGGWYNQGDFYSSAESRIERVNLQTFKAETLFQITSDYELSLGQQAFTALAGTAPAFTDAQVEGYLQQLVNRMTHQTPGPAFRYRVSILSSPEVNAVTPPGHIIVNTGLLGFVENESELAAVLAHELAHNYGHHSARRLIKGYHAQNVARALTSAVNPQSATAQLLTQLATGLGVGLFVLAAAAARERFLEIERQATALREQADACTQRFPAPDPSSVPPSPRLTGIKFPVQRMVVKAGTTVAVPPVVLVYDDNTTAPPDGSANVQYGGVPVPFTPGKGDANRSFMVSASYGGFSDTMTIFVDPGTGPSILGSTTTHVDPKTVEQQGQGRNLGEPPPEPPPASLPLSAPAAPPPSPNPGAGQPAPNAPPPPGPGQGASDWAGTWELAGNQPGTMILRHPTAEDQRSDSYRVHVTYVKSVICRQGTAAIYYGSISFVQGSGGPVIACVIGAELHGRFSTLGDAELHGFFTFRSGRGTWGDVRYAAENEWRIRKR